MDLRVDFTDFPFLSVAFVIDSMLRMAFCIYENGTGHYFLYLRGKIAHQIFCVSYFLNETCRTHTPYNVNTDIMIGN